MTKIVFFGNERLISGLKHTDTPILHGLLSRGYQVAAIVTHDTDSRSRNKRPLEVAQIASERNIPLFNPPKPIEIAEDLQKIDADIAVLVAYGRIIPQSIIDLFPLGIINIHPSLLPVYRGSTPIESAILNGDTQTGVSIMQLTSGMDEGPIFAQKSLQLSGNESKQDLYNRLTNLSVQIFFDTLPLIIAGNAPTVAQDDTMASYTKTITKDDAIINWREPSAIILNKIRAYTDWPQSKTTIGGVDIIVTQATSSDTTLNIGELRVNDSRLWMGTADTAIEITHLKPLGKKEMPVKAFLLGYKLK